MCLAVPMRLISVTGSPADVTSQQVGVVESGGVQKRVRLDLVDRWPEVGDYVIVHAGFAIQVLDEKEAQISLGLFKELADGARNLADEG